MYIISSDTTALVLLGSLFVCFFIQIFYYLYFYAKPLLYQNKIKKNETTSQTIEDFPGVSVIISAKNESRNLTEFLPSILEQDYKNFEVIVVNSGSSDETENVLGLFEQKYSNLYKTYIPENTRNISHKKLALTVGIKAAKHDILLFTEANSRPLSNNWISSMVRKFDKKTDIILGFSRLNKTGFMSALISFDNLLTGLKYLSCAIMKRPYMGTGNNLAYRKDLFFAKKGFSKYLYLQFGEDDLFINESANRNNTQVEMSMESITETNIKSFKIWKNTKICREVTQSYYKGKEVNLWRFEYLSRFLFWGLTITCCILYWNTILIPAISALLFVLKFLIQYLTVGRSAKMLQNRSFSISLLLFDLLQPVFDMYFYFYRTFVIRNDYI